MKAITFSEIIANYPDFTFVADDKYMWSPQTKTISYLDKIELDSSALNIVDLYSLFHEIGHALEDHQDYRFDVELIQLERAAWERALLEADKFGVKIDEDHIENSMDSYRSWLVKRALCPDCEIAGIQANSGDYGCLNCTQTWKVPAEANCVVRRRRILA